MLNCVPDWLCALLNPVSRALGRAIFNDDRPLCAIAWDRCGRAAWAWRFVRLVGAVHASESFEAAPVARPVLPTRTT